MPYMWADTLAAAERMFLLCFLVWGLVSIIAGTALLAWLRVGQRHSPLIKHFAIQTAGWGAAGSLVALTLLSAVANRDLASATRLDRLLWLNVGLDAGYVLVGATLITTGWKLGRRMGLVGAGIGIIVQALAFAILDLVLASQISR